MAEQAVEKTEVKPQESPKEPASSDNGSLFVRTQADTKFSDDNKNTSKPGSDKASIQSESADKQQSPLFDRVMKDESGSRDQIGAKPADGSADKNKTTNSEAKQMLDDFKLVDETMTSPRSKAEGNESGKDDSKDKEDDLKLKEQPVQEAKLGPPPPAEDLWKDPETQVVVVGDNHGNDQAKNQVKEMMEGLQKLNLSKDEKPVLLLEPLSPGEGSELQTRINNLNPNLDLEKTLEKLKKPDEERTPDEQTIADIIKTLDEQIHPAAGESPEAITKSYLEMIMAARKAGVDLVCPEENPQKGLKEALDEKGSKEALEVIGNPESKPEVIDKAKDQLKERLQKDPPGMSDEQVAELMTAKDFDRLLSKVPATLEPTMEAVLNPNSSEAERDQAKKSLRPELEKAGMSTQDTDKILAGLDGMGQDLIRRNEHFKQETEKQLEGPLPHRVIVFAGKSHFGEGSGTVETLLKNDGKNVRHLGY